MEDKRNSVFGPFVAVLLVVIAAMLVILVDEKQVFEVPPVREVGDWAAKQSMVSYVNSAYGISFEYPSGYYLRERSNVGAPGYPQLSLVLVQDTPMNRDILDGKATEAMEGPTSITVDAYQNPKKISVRDWAENEADWRVEMKNSKTVVVSGKEGFSFEWDGLYRGKSILLANGEKIYVFTVTWLTPEDQIIKDFDMVLDTVRTGNRREKQLTI
jgi:hypothetical protein